MCLDESTILWNNSVGTAACIRKERDGKKLIVRSAVAPFWNAYR